MSWTKSPHVDWLRLHQRVPQPASYNMPMVWVPPDFPQELASFCVQYGLGPDEAIFEVKDRRVRQVLDQFAVAAGISRRIDPHLLRAGRGHLVAEAHGGLNNPTSVQLVKKFLQHKGKGSDAALRYLRPSQSDVDAAVRKKWK